MNKNLNQNSSAASGSPAVPNFSTITTPAATFVSNAITSPIMTSSNTTTRFSQQQKTASPPSPEPGQTSAASQTKAQSVLESNGLKPRKPCNCTKSQCLKLYLTGGLCYF